jgi:hypothetical protein
MESKTCCRCKETKLMSEYYAQGGACKVCTCKRARELYAARTPEQAAARRHTQTAYAKNNWDRKLELARAQNKKPNAKEWLKKYREKNKEFLAARTRAYYERNRDALLAYHKRWQQLRPEKCAQYYETYIAKPTKRERMVVRAKKYRTEASAGYVRMLLSRHTTVQPSDIPTELVEAKRMQLQILRRVRDGNNT